MDNETGMPQWLVILIAIGSTLGIKEVISYLVKAHGEERKAKIEKKIKDEDTNGHVLLDTIDDMRKDISRQKDVEVELRNKLSDERAEKVRYRTRLQVMMEELKKHVEDAE